MVHASKLASLKHTLPGLEDTHHKRKKPYSESSRQSIRDTAEEWKKAAAEKRSVQHRRDRDEFQTTAATASTAKRNTPTERPKGTTARRNSSTTNREFMQPENEGPVIVTNYSQSPRNSMNATQIGTDRGASLCFHQPVRGSLQLNSAKQDVAATVKPFENKPN